MPAPDRIKSIDPGHPPRTLVKHSTTVSKGKNIIHDFYGVTPIRPLASETGRRKMAVLPPDLPRLLVELEPMLLRQARVRPFHSNAAPVADLYVRRRVKRNDARDSNAAPVADLYVLDISMEFDENAEPIWQEAYAHMTRTTALTVLNLIMWARSVAYETEYVPVGIPEFESAMLLAA